MAAHNELGRWGEDLATAYLEQKGYTIVERDVFGEPEEAVDFHKLQHLQQAINHYVKFKHIRQPIRFDIISIVGTIGKTPDIRHIQDVTLI